MTSSSHSSDDPRYHSAAPRMVPGDQPGDYGVASPDAWPGSRRGTGENAPDPGNVEDIDQLTAPLDDDDDVAERLQAVNRDGGQ